MAMAVTIGVLLLHCFILYLFVTRCPNPYMDETFHVPQAQKYCAGDFWNWDPKITTLPGTYLFSGFTLLPRILHLGPEAGCSTSALRSVNAIVLGPLAAFLAGKVLEAVHGNVEQKGLALSVRQLRVVLMPLHFFFCFLYYTDAASTSVVLLMYLLHCRNWRRSSALVGALAVVMRQTNIVWVWGLAVHCFSGPGGPSAWLSRLFVQLRSGVVLPHAAVGAAFVAFVFINEGIVVGDRENHTAVAHLAMMPYLAAFVIAFLGPATWIELLLRLPHVKLRAFVEGVLATMCFAAMAHFGSYAHPFLLADNRHVTFYLWKDLLRKNWARCALLPVALGFATAAFRTQGERPFAICPSRDVALWALCCALVVVPTPLLEFRYFVVPATLALIHQSVGTVLEEFAALSTSIAINFLTMSVFLNRPFKSAAWGEEPQRFMW